MVVVVVVGTSPLVFFATFLDPEEDEEELEDEEDEEEDDESEGLGEGAFRLTPATGAAWVGLTGASASESESDELEDEELDEEEEEEEEEADFALATTVLVAPIPGRVTGASSSELESELESDEEEDDEEDDEDDEDEAGEGALAALGAATAVLAPIPGRLTSSSSSLLDSELLDSALSAIFPWAGRKLTRIVIVRLCISLGTALFSLHVQKTRSEGGINFLVRV